MYFNKILRKNERKLVTLGLEFHSLFSKFCIVENFCKILLSQGREYSGLK